MTTKNGDMPAMPNHQVWQDCGIDGNSGPHYVETVHHGLTKREMMAMHMMANLMLHEGIGSYEDAAMCATSAADALLAELERTK